MAVIDIQPINLSEPVEPEVFATKRTDPRTIDPADIVLAYDRRSDTMYVYYFGRDRETISVNVSGDGYELVDPETGEVVGLQLESFLAHTVPSYPNSIEALDVAELRGITPAEIREIRHRVLRPRWRLAATVARLLHRHAQGQHVSELKRQAVATLQRVNSLPSLFPP